MILAIGRRSKRAKGFTPLEKTIGFNLPAAHPVRERNSLTGFTLIELAMVISIMMILVLLAMPTFSKIYLDSKLRSSAQAITWILRYAYQVSISEGVRYRAHFDVYTGTYWLEKQEYGNRPSSFNKINTALLKEKNLPEGITFKKAIPPDITLSPTGLGESAYIYLTDSKGSVYTIVFSGLTGQVTVLDHEKQ